MRGSGKKGILRAKNDKKNLIVRVAVVHNFDILGVGLPDPGHHVEV